MKALVLAAGLGTRLRDIAPNTPKTLMEIGDVPLLEITIEKLFRLGVSDIMINTHYLHQKIENYISQQRYRDRIELVFEPNLLGTAGTLKKNFSKFEDNDFLVLHGDNYFADSLQKLLSQHRTSGEEVLVSMGVFTVENPKDFGTLRLNEDSIVTEYFEKDPKSIFRTANSAIYIMKPSIKKFLHSLSDEENDISRDLIPKLVNRILAVPLDGYFLDIGTPENYNIARKL